MLKHMYYNAGKNTITQGEGVNYEIPKNNDFAWVFMQSPIYSEVQKVCKDFSIDLKYFKTFSRENRSIRYSINPLIFVFIDYYLENNKVKTSRILFVLKENALIIVMQRKTIFHRDLFDQLVKEFEVSKKKNLIRLMHQFLIDDVDENYEVIERVENIIAHLEKSVNSGNEKKVHDIINYKRAIYRMSRRFWGSAKIVYLIKKGLTPLRVDMESMVLLDDVYNTYMHQIDILTSAKEMLSDILAAYEIRVQNDLNLVIKKLTAITVILMVPTLIASMYGMNFKHMPELDSPLGYPVTIILMLSSILVLAIFFHRKNWF
jgi:magnesium transporter